MLGAKVSGLFALDVHHTDEPVFGNQRYCQLRAHIGIGKDIFFRTGNVVQQYRLAGERHLARHALAHGNALPLHLRAVADLESHAQFSGAVVEQQNGEDAVGDDGAHQLRGAAQQGFQVQRGVQRVGQLH